MRRGKRVEQWEADCTQGIRIFVIVHATRNPCSLLLGSCSTPLHASGSIRPDLIPPTVFVRYCQRYCYVRLRCNIDRSFAHGKRVGQSGIDTSTLLLTVAQVIRVQTLQLQFALRALTAGFSTRTIQVRQVVLLSKEGLCGNLVPYRAWCHAWCQCTTSARWTKRWRTSYTHSSLQFRLDSNPTIQFARSLPSVTVRQSRLHQSLNVK